MESVKKPEETLFFVLLYVFVSFVMSDTLHGMRERNMLAQIDCEQKNNFIFFRTEQKMRFIYKICSTIYNVISDWVKTMIDGILLLLEHFCCHF